MKKLLGLVLIIFSLLINACRQDPKATSQNQTKPVEVQLPDSVLLAQADSLYDAAEKIADLKKSDSALGLHKRALEIREKLLINDIRLVNSYYKVGRVYYQENKFDAADKYLENSRRIAEKIDAPLQIIFSIYEDLSSCKREMKDFPTATSLGKRFLQLAINQKPVNKKMMTHAYDKLASIFLEQKQFDEAIESWAMAIRLTPHDSHELLSIFFFNTSIAYNNSGQLQKSLEYINRAIYQDLIEVKQD